MLFSFSLTGWEGSASDAWVYEDTRCSSVNVPGKRRGSTKGAEYVLIRGLG